MGSESIHVECCVWWTWSKQTQVADHRQKLGLRQCLCPPLVAVAAACVNGPALAYSLCPVMSHRPGSKHALFEITAQRVPRLLGRLVTGVGVKNQQSPQLPSLQVEWVAVLLFPQQRFDGLADEFEAKSLAETFDYLRGLVSLCCGSSATS